MSKLKWLLVVLAALGAGGGVWWWFAGEERAAEPEPQYTESYIGDLAVEITATGTVEPEYVVELKSKASGMVQTIHVVPGDVVKNMRDHLGRLPA